MNIAAMTDLVNRLNDASEAYYNSNEVMPNYEWDDLFNQLLKLEAKEGVVLPNSPTRNVGAPAVDSLEKFKHTYPAKSLDKTKDIDLFYRKFEEGIAASNSGNDNVVVMYKEDGSTAQAYYKNGRLSLLVTRGNGEVGNVVTHNARNIEGLPITIPFTGELVVRGEVLISYDDFSAINSALPADQQFKNPRNLAAASLTMLDSNETKDRHLAIKAFNLVFKDGFDLEESFAARLAYLEELGFSVVDYKKCSLSELKATMDEFSDNVKSYPYPVDGLVVAMDNYIYTKRLEGTEHHPHIMQGYAFKWEDEVQETVLREIEWSPSRTGLLNPVAVFDSVEIDGTTVSRASIHNVSILSEMNLHVGDRITVYKANLVIPQIAENFDKDAHSKYTLDELVEAVGYCPTCGEKVEINRSLEGILTAFCPNAECPEKMIGKLVHFCERDCMDIQGMSEETVKKLVEAGFIKEYCDLFTLDQKPGIAFLPGFGKQSWNKLCAAAEKAKTTDFVKFFTALGIPDIGKGQIKALKKYLNTHYEDIANDVHVDPNGYNLGGLLSAMGRADYPFEKIDGFGEILATNLRKWLKEKFNFADTWTPEVNVYGYLTFTDKPESLVADSKISGKSFCITGKLAHYPNRQALVAEIEAHGGKWVDSVSSKTDFLINNDTESTTGKNKKAKELNIPVISEETFIEMLN